MGEGEAGKQAKTTPDTGGKSDWADDIQKERDDNGGDDTEEDEDDEDDEEHGEGRIRRAVKTETGAQLLLHNISSERIHWKEGGIVTVMCHVGGHVGVVCFIATRKILGFYVSVVNCSRLNVLKEGWLLTSARRPSPCQTMALLEVSPSPQPEDQDSPSHP